MRKITPRQEEILKFLRESQQQRGYPPSLREIGQRFRIASTNGVRYHLGVLEKEGFLKREGYTSRGIRLAGQSLRGTSPGVPLVGQVAAGPLNLALEEAEREVHLDRPLFSLSEQEKLFCLRVQGESMNGAGILEGDIVIVRREVEPRRGQIVVARLGEEATVKRFEKRGRKVVLCPDNPAYPPIEVSRDPGEEFQVLGVVVGLIRTEL